MFKKSLKILGGLTLTTVALVKLAKLDIDSFPLSTLYPSLYKFNSSLAQSFLSSLIYWNCLKPLPKSNTYLVLDQRWDTNASHLQQLHQIGFDLVINGPATFIPQSQNQLGIRYLKTKFIQFKQQHKDQIVAVSVLPNQDVCTYTPYLISVDLIRTIQQVERAVDYVMVDLGDERFPKEYVSWNNIQQLYEKIAENNKGKENVSQKKAKILFRYLDQIINIQNLNTQEVKQKLKDNTVKEGESNQINGEILSKALNKSNVKIVTAKQFFRNPSLKQTSL